MELVWEYKLIIFNYFVKIFVILIDIFVIKTIDILSL